MVDAKSAFPMDTSPSKLDQDAEIRPSGTDTTTADIPLWKRVWRHSLTQMVILSIQSFCGPAMSDAITGACLPVDGLIFILLYPAL